MSRFEVVSQPERQPGIDYVTGTAVGPFIDTGKDITIGERNFGRIYLSKDTVREMARELGLLGENVGSEALVSAYTQGKLDGLRETLGGDIYRVVNTLDRWLDDVRAGMAAAETGTQGV